MAIELKHKICPACGGSGIDDNVEMEDNAPIPDCEECGGTGYIEQIRHAPKKVKRKE